MNKLLREKKAAAVCFLILGLCAFFSCDIWDLSVPDYIENQLNRGKDRGSGGSDNPGGPDLPLPPGPRIIAAVPGYYQGDFTLYWYIEANPDFGEAVSMKVSSGFSSTGDIPKTSWNGGGEFTAPYITEIQMGASVSKAATLTLTVSNADGEKSFVIEDPAAVTGLPVYVCETPVPGDQGILPGSPISLADTFDPSKILSRYSDIKVIVTETINNAGQYAMTLGKKVIIEPSETGGNVTINKNGQGWMFAANNNAGLTIQGKSGNTIEFRGLSTNDNALFSVDHAKLTMNEGASITENNSGSTTTGGGVYVLDGTFNMTGGEISGNDAYSGGGVYVTGNEGRFNMTGGKISGNNADFGGGVYVDTDVQFTMEGSAEIFNNGTEDHTAGGGVYVNSSGSGSFTMNGGTISENKGKNGGGVYVFPVGGADPNDIDFTMIGGKISGNTASECGGGVYVNSSQFVMQGGSILGNESKGVVLDMGGGGVAVVRSTSAAAFYMSGGSIGENAVGNRNTALNGGGVFITNGEFKMTGGTIEGNIAEDPQGSSNEGHGGGVYLYKANDLNSETFVMKNGSSIKNNRAVNGNGGGVHIAQYFDFEMGGGDVPDIISGNTASKSGGGVYIENGNFTMTGSIIGTTDGEVTDSDNQGNTANLGGGVYFNGGTFTMTNGTIAQNKAIISGGGVYIKSEDFIMNNGTIGGYGSDSNGNLALDSGGGVYIEGGEFTMNDGEISNNNAGNEGGGVYVNTPFGLFTRGAVVIIGNTAGGGSDDVYE